MKNTTWRAGVAIAVMLTSLAAVSTPAPARARAGNEPICQIMDRFMESLLSAETAYFFDADAGNGRTRLLELGGKANLAYFRLPFGNIDVRTRVRGTWFFDSGDVRLPNQLFLAELPLTWMGRFDDGFSTRLTLKPGYFGDGEQLTDDAIFIPLSFSMVRALADDLSLVAGLEYRSGFERRWFPVFGSVWQPHPALRIEALLPEGMISLAPARDWRVNLGYAWESLDYRLDDPRRKINVEDFRMVLGISRVMHTEMELSADVGYVVKRRMIYCGSPGERLDVDDAVFIRFGVAAPF